MDDLNDPMKLEGHQDDHTPWEELTTEAKANCHADHICTVTYQLPPQQVGHFPEWVPGLKAGLLHNGKLVMKKIPEYVTITTTAPHHKIYLIEKSLHCDAVTDSSLICGPIKLLMTLTGRPLNPQSKQCPFAAVSKSPSLFVHDWTPTKHQIALFYNSID
jgi:hypothetical protein